MNIKKKFLILLMSVCINASNITVSMQQDVALLTINNSLAPLSVFIFGKFPVPMLEPLELSDASNRSRSLLIPFLTSALLSGFVGLTNFMLLSESDNHQDRNNNGYLYSALAVATVGNFAQVGLMGYIGYQRYQKTIECNKQKSRLLELINKKRSGNEEREMNELIKRCIQSSTKLS